VPGASTKAEVAQHYRVDATKPSVPFRYSSKEQTPNVASKTATQAKVVTPDPNSTMPIQSRSLPPETTKKRATRASTPLPKKRPKVSSKRGASLSNDLHGEQSNRNGPTLEEKPAGTFPIYTNSNNAAYDVPEPPKDVVSVNEVINRNIQVVALTYTNPIAHMKYTASKSNDVSPPDPGNDRQQRMHVNPDVAYSLKQEDQMEIIDSEANTGPSSPSSYEEDIFFVEEEDDDDEILGDPPQVEPAYSSQIGQRVSQATLCQ